MRMFNFMEREVTREWWKLRFADGHRYTIRHLLFWWSSLRVCSGKGIQHLRDITGESSAIVCEHLSEIGRLEDLVVDRTKSVPLQTRGAQRFPGS